MRVLPCSTCYLRRSCERFDSIKFSFSCSWDGMKSLTAKMKCDWHDRLYSPGVRVSVHLHEYASSDREHHDYEHFDEGDFTGTISRISRKGRVVVWMDGDVGDRIANQIITVPFGRIMLINEPPVNVCLCGKPEGKKNHDSWSCDECDKLPDIEKKDGNP